MKLFRATNETIPSSDDGNPDTFPLILRRLNAIHQTMEPDTGVHHHTLYPVLAHQNAALGIVGIVAGMDADALETGNTLHIRQPLLESARLGDKHTIRTLGEAVWPGIFLATLPLSRLKRAFSSSGFSSFPFRLRQVGSRVSQK